MPSLTYLCMTASQPPLCGAAGAHDVETVPSKPVQQVGDRLGLLDSAASSVVMSATLPPTATLSVILGEETR